MIIEQIEGGRIIDCRSDDNCLFRDYRPMQPLSDSLPHSEMVEPRRSWIALFFREGGAQGSPCHPPFDVPIRFRSSRSEYLQLSRKYPIGFVVVDLYPHYRAPPHYRRVLANRIPGVFGRKFRNDRTSGHGQSIN
jgi:hypothetical protein